MNETVINPQPGLLNGFAGRGGPDAGGGISQFCHGFGPDLTGTCHKFKELKEVKLTKSQY